MDIALELRGVNIGWGQLTVLSELSLALAHGEALCIVGPGRSGKSTLLRAIEGMVEGRPCGPELWWRGSFAPSIASCARLRQHGEVHDRRVGEVLAAAGLLDSKERWLQPLEAAGEAAAQAVNASLDLPLRALADPMRRYLSFVLVAHSNAPMLLLDEPLFALTGPWAEAVHARLTQLTQERKTMIIVTHYLPLARAVADRVTLIVDGEVIESATTEDFFTRPQHPRTRQYIEWGG